MFKNLISPVQAWLLSQGQCVGCGMPLNKAVEKKNSHGELVAICKCGRGYLKLGDAKYRRARLSQLQ